MDLSHEPSEQSVFFNVNKTLLLCVCVCVKDDMVAHM